MLATTTTAPNDTLSTPKTIGRRGRPATTHDNARVSQFLGESLSCVTSPAVDARIDDVLTGALELAGAGDTRTRTLRRKVLRAILVNCGHLSVQNIQQVVTGDRYADRTVRAYAELARVASRGIQGVMSRVHYCRTDREWQPLGEHVIAHAEFIPAATEGEDIPEREMNTVCQLQSELDAAYTADRKAAEAQGTLWSPAIARGLPSTGNAHANAMRYGAHMDLVGSAPEA